MGSMVGMVKFLYTFAYLLEIPDKPIDRMPIYIFLQAILFCRIWKTFPCNLSIRAKTRERILFWGCAYCKVLKIRNIVSRKTAIFTKDSASDCEVMKGVCFIGQLVRLNNRDLKRERYVQLAKRKHFNMLEVIGVWQLNII